MGRLSSLAVKAAQKAAKAAESRAVSAAERNAVKSAERVVKKTPAPKPKAAPPKIKFPDEGDWELPDLNEEVAVYTAPVQRPSLSVPAKAAPPRAKVEAYHGTPHRFAPETKVRDRETGEELFIESARVDPSNLPSGVEIVQQYPLGRFRMDKIGTGEGAQAYGHGLYFAEAEDVAKNYRNALARPDPRDMVGNAYDLVRILGEKDALENLKGLNSKEAMDTAEAITSGSYKRYKPPGSIYQVGLDVDPAKMLAWDVPVTEQPEVLKMVQPLLQKYQIEGLDNGKYPTLGGDLYHQLRLRSDVRDRAMSDMLTGAGIPGIRYLDQGSRSRGTGTENYVMMNPDLIEIMKRYNMGGKVEVNG